MTRRDPSAAHRIAIGFGLGFVAAFAPMMGLGLWFGVRSPWPTWSLLVIASSLVLSLLCFLYAFSGLIFFRCPNCKTRVRRPNLVANSEEDRICFVCPKCKIEWDSLWTHRAGD
jgi:hypothetical protein